MRLMRAARLVYNWHWQVGHFTRRILQLRVHHLLRHYRKYLIKVFVYSFHSNRTRHCIRPEIGRRVALRCWILHAIFSPETITRDRGLLTCDDHDDDDDEVVPFYLHLYANVRRWFYRCECCTSKCSNQLFSAMIQTTSSSTISHLRDYKSS